MAVHDCWSTSIQQTLNRRRVNANPQHRTGTENKWKQRYPILNTDNVRTTYPVHEMNPSSLLTAFRWWCLWDGIMMQRKWEILRIEQVLNMVRFFVASPYWQLRSVAAPASRVIQSSENVRSILLVSQESLYGVKALYVDTIRRRVYNSIR